MHTFGFSTGALALGDFRAGISILSGHNATAIEISALRDHELSELVRCLPGLDLSAFEYVSVHAPSRYSTASEAECADLLSVCIDRGFPVVLHPDAIRDAGAWDRFGSLLCIENMDKRKSDGRTVAELGRWFDRFPDAGFCLDLGHARQIDPSLGLARALIREFGSRLTQIHLSELNTRSAHFPLSMPTVRSLQVLSAVLDQPVPVILESQVRPECVAQELDLARSVFQGPHAVPVAVDGTAN